MFWVKKHIKFDSKGLRRVDFSLAFGQNIPTIFAC